MKRPVVTAALLVAFSGALTSLSAQAPVATTVCEIAYSPTKFQGKLVKLRAEVMSDGMERTVLIDSEKDCGKGLVPFLDEKTEPDPFAPIEDALGQGHPGTLDKKIVASFVGKFRFRPSEFPPRVLIIEAVSDIHVSFISDQKKDQRKR